MTLDQINKKLKDANKLQAYYFNLGKQDRVATLAQKIDELMKQREELIEEDTPTNTDWYWKHLDDEAGESELYE